MRSTLSRAIAASLNLAPALTAHYYDRFVQAYNADDNDACKNV